LALYQPHNRSFNLQLSLFLRHPIEGAAKIAVRTVRETLAKQNGGIEVTFCCFSERGIAVYKALL
jgi:O-acetyl-ADP-ribose deacetylase (regulator of RNase III)